MKTGILQNLLLVAVAATLSLTGCKKDSLTDKLKGDWEVKSWVEDGDEYIGNDFSRVDLEFEEADGNEGDTNWTIVFDDGTTDSITGEYEVDEDKDEITITFDGESVEFDMDLDGDDLELSGNIDGYFVTIKAERD